MGNGWWEGWLEFVPLDGGEPLRTARETEQLTQGDLRFWAGRLTPAYLQDALRRTLSPQHIQTGSATALSVMFGTGQSAVNADTDERPLRAGDFNVLDPIAFYNQFGEYALRQELRALSARELQTIVAINNFSELDLTDAARTFEDALAEQIVAGVQHRVGPVTKDPPSVPRSIRH